MRRIGVWGMVGMALVFAGVDAHAGPLRDRWRARAAEQGALGVAGAKKLTDVSYGNGAKEALDAYVPANASHAPIIVMVHGGAWRIGDKEHSRVIENKGKEYLSKGYLFISIGYPLLPEANPLQQVDAVARAVVFVQKYADEWGGDTDKLILMGHSAGAHIVAMLGADPSRVGRKWAGTVALDSAAMDVPAIMARKHYGFYDAAFGEDPAFWQAVSPIHHLGKNATPFVLVCSSKRSDSCPPNEAFAAKANSLGVAATVHQEARTHGEINEDLGLPGPYTDAVDDFIARALAAQH